VVCKPLPTSTISAAAVYRAIEAMHPTLLIDEADQSVKDKPELIGVLDGGYERGQFAIRVVGEDNEARAFDLFSPVALAGIGRLAGQLEDRSIRLPMQRALTKAEKITDATEQRAEELARRIARWVSDNHQALADAKPDTSELPDRVDDHWTPLYAIAAVIGDNWPLLATAAQKALSPGDDGTDSLGEQLIHDIHKIFTGGEGQIGSSEVDRLVGLEGRPWCEMGKSRKPLTTNRLARLLKGFRIVPKHFGPDDARTRGYDHDDFRAAFRQYPSRADGP